MHVFAYKQFFWRPGTSEYNLQSVRSFETILTREYNSEQIFFSLFQNSKIFSLDCSHGRLRLKNHNNNGKNIIFANIFKNF